MKIRTLIVASLLACTAVQADTEATTKDGRKVLLKDNGLWEYIVEDSVQQQPKAVLELKLKDSSAHGCRLGLKMTNELAMPIRTLVLRFTAYKEGGIAFETVSRGFSRIKPTKDQYQEIRFRGTSCEDIAQVQVRAAHNCHVGELTKYSASEETCLALVRTMPSDLITIFQAPSDN